ncbi:MAG TPA: hypothetical protein VFO62_01575 [Candidatus Binatia bacterium]|jgi:hypothetical protein|nr:hypothetical protein [Candidatus Binatia bacterium]
MTDSARDRHQAEERLNDLFEPDVLLPIQYFAALKRKRFSSGEHRLLIAIMQDAVECFQKHIHARDSKRRQLYLDAESWISSEDYSGTFSFNNVCDLLGMSPEYLRQGLIDWRDRERSRRRGRLFDAVRSHGIRERVRIESLGSVTDFLEGEVALLAIEP